MVSLPLLCLCITFLGSSCLPPTAAQPVESQRGCDEVTERCIQSQRKGNWTVVCIADNGYKGTFECTDGQWRLTHESSGDERDCRKHSVVRCGQDKGTWTERCIADNGSDGILECTGGVWRLSWTGTCPGGSSPCIRQAAGGRPSNETV